MRSPQKPLNVLVLTGMYPTETMPRNGLAVVTQVSALRESGVNVKVLNIRETGSRSFIRNIAIFRRAALKPDVEVVHVHYGLKATLIGLFSPVPVVATYHGTDINGWTWKGSDSIIIPLLYNTAAWIVRNLSRRFQAVIVMSQEMKGRLPRNVQKRTSVIPMGIDTSHFTKIEQQSARRTLGWGDETVVAFGNSNLKAIKRQDLAEAAISILQERIPGLRLHVIDGVEPDLMPIVLSAADCLLITSDKEGAPNILREALSCGLPVVSVPVGDVPEVLERFPGAGKIVSREPEDIAKGLEMVLLKPVEFADTELIGEFSTRFSAAKVIDVYRSIARDSQ